MANKLKTYTILTLLVFGLVFLGIGCAGKNSGDSSPAQKSLQKEPQYRKLLPPKHHRALLP